MTSIRKTCVQLGLALLALGGSASHAFQGLPQQVQPYSQRAEDPGEALSRNLTALATDPQSVGALTGAGRAALQLGDYQAALNFFARAEELAPRDGRIKAGIGSSLVMMEQGRTALKFFSDAQALGVPEAEMAGDRGLAFDLAGDPRQAQRDYRMALARVENPEIRRRLALSLGISGDRHEALATIDAQVRQQDRAAWRTRAFVLALTGDTAGATQAVQAVMPAQAAALHPFLARLPTLSLSDRALAVHFGHFPDDGAMVQAPAASAPAAATGMVDPTRAGQPDAAQRQLGATSSATVPATPSGTQLGAVSLAQSSPTAAPVAPTVTTPIQARQPATGPPPAATSTGQIGPRLSDPAPTATTFQPSQSPTLTAGSPTYSSIPERQPALPTALPGLIQSTDVAAGPTTPAQTLPPLAAPALDPPPTTTNIPTFADVASLIAALPANDEPTSPPARAIASNPPEAAKPAASTTSPPAAARTSATSTKPSTQAPRATRPRAPAKPREPSRIWVQVAGGANEAALPREYARLKARAPKLFAGRTAWTTSVRATNRLLVGPFKTNKEAQAFVNQLEAASLAGFAWTSADGQEIKKLVVK